MPELPEVENIALGLREHIVGQTIDSLHIVQPLIVKGPFQHRRREAVDAIMGATITGVGRRAKRLMILTDAPLSLVVQLGMTGQFLIADPAVARPKHTHLYAALSGGDELRFVDPRRFGRVWFLAELDPDRPDEVMLAAGLGPLGPEPLAITAAEFRRALAGKRAVKTLLLDQTRIAGLGNIYADEALFKAGIHPTTPAGELRDEQAEKLRRAIRMVLRSAIKHGGTTFSDYRNAHGEMGRFLRRLQVYQRGGAACRICGAAIERLVLTGRSSHFCPRCQRPK